MDRYYKITDRNGRTLREGRFTEPEIRMAAKAGFRVFESDDVEITPKLTGLFDSRIE